MKETKFNVGWFGEPGKHGQTKTHIIDDLGKLFCGSRVASQKEFQWCFNILDAERLKYIGCDHCRRIAREALREE